jgi:hypothetical protein
MPLTIQGVEVKPKPLEGLSIEELEKLERYYDAEGDAWWREYRIFWEQHGAVPNWEKAVSRWNRAKLKLTLLRLRADEWYALKKLSPPRLKSVG